MRPHHVPASLPQLHETSLYQFTGIFKRLPHHVRLGGGVGTFRVPSLNRSRATTITAKTIHLPIKLTMHPNLDTVRITQRARLYNHDFVSPTCNGPHSPACLIPHFKHDLANSRSTIWDGNGSGRPKPRATHMALYMAKAPS